MGRRAAMVEAVIRAAASAAKLRVRFKEEKASRGKVVRAEPLSALYEEGKVHHVGAFPALEDQLIAFTTHGFMGDCSPDRADVLIWGLSEIFPRVVSGEASWKSTRQGSARSRRANLLHSGRGRNEKHEAPPAGGGAGLSGQPASFRAMSERPCVAWFQPECGSVSAARNGSGGARLSQNILHRRGRERQRPRHRAGGATGPGPAPAPLGEDAAGTCMKF
jgi:hypothetical protein